MAKKSTGKPAYPIQRSFPMVLGGSPDANALLRVDHVLSSMNHRLYRQSRKYHVKLDIDPSVADDTVVEVYALCDTWWLNKAYQLAYETFLENSKEERAASKTSVARWNDFRVDHGLGNTFQKELQASGKTDPTGTPSAYSTGEYVASKVHTAAGTSTSFVFTGSLSNTWNIIDQYDVAGNTNTEPTTPSSVVPYSGLEQEISSGQMDHMQDDGNNPPYSRTGLNNAVWIKVATLNRSASGGTQRLSTGFFTAPAGLVCLVSNTTFRPDATILNLEVKAGDYKGVAGTTMLNSGAIYASSSKKASASHDRRMR